MRRLKQTVVISTLAVLSTACMNPVKQQHNELVGQWNIVEIEQKKITSEVAVLNFTNDGKVYGNNGCNRLSGKYEPVQDHLNLSGLVSTKMFCPGAASLNEKAFNAALPKIEHFLVQQDRLLLTDKHDEPVITLLK